MKSFKKYCNIFIYKIIPLLVFKILPMLILSSLYIYIASDVYLCDDDYLTNQEYTWGGELDGRPQYVYQPYRPGLQYTSNGYRYEMDGAPNGNQYNEYLRSHPYTRAGTAHWGDYYEDHRDSNSSLQLGLIEPTNSEVIRYGLDKHNDAYHSDAVHHGPGRPNSIRKALWEFVKDDVRKTQAKVQASRAKIDAQNNLSGKILRETREAAYIRRMEKSNEAVRHYDSLRKVRRFA
jgi:hypothetical protein